MPENDENTFSPDYGVMNKTIGTRVSEDIYDALAKYAAERGKSPSEALREIIYRQLRPIIIMDELNKIRTSRLFTPSAENPTQLEKTTAYIDGLHIYLSMAQRARDEIADYLAKIDAQNDRIGAAVDAMRSYFKEHPFEDKKEAPDIDKTEPSQT